MKNWRFSRVTLKLIAIYPPQEDNQIIICSRIRNRQPTCFNAGYAIRLNKNKAMNARQLERQLMKETKKSAKKKMYRMVGAF